MSVLIILICNGENIFGKIAQNIIIDKIEEIAMEVIVETELHDLPQNTLQRIYEGDLKILKLREN